MESGMGREYYDGRKIGMEIQMGMMGMEGQEIDGRMEMEDHGPTRKRAGEGIGRRHKIRIYKNSTYRLAAYFLCVLNLVRI